MKFSEKEKQEILSLLNISAHKSSSVSHQPIPKRKSVWTFTEEEKVAAKEHSDFLYALIEKIENEG
tara:strand:+ start:241 stop:438 length:198 start_codon:yes stop_codon:yes gene_type:complete